MICRYHQLELHIKKLTDDYITDMVHNNRENKIIDGLRHFLKELDSVTKHFESKLTKIAEMWSILD